MRAKDAPMLWDVVLDAMDAGDLEGAHSVVVNYFGGEKKRTGRVTPKSIYRVTKADGEQADLQKQRDVAKYLEVSFSSINNFIRSKSTTYAKLKGVTIEVIPYQKYVEECY